MPGIDLEFLIDHVLTYLDLDPRYWDQQTGVFEFDGCKVLYERFDDAYFLTIDNLLIELPRS